MTGSEFSDDSSLEIMCGIIHTLSLPAQACGPPGALLQVLGVELLECLYWRVGALLYMYCYSVHQQMWKGKEVDREKFVEVWGVGGREGKGG